MMTGYPYSAPRARGIKPRHAGMDTKTSAQRNAAIENIPPETSHVILAALDYKKLPMARASPTFYQQYLLDRRVLLPGCLERTLGAATIDTCAVYRSNPESFTDERTRDWVAAFLEPYQSRPSLVTYSISDEGLAEEDVEALLAFHLSIDEEAVET